MKSKLPLFGGLIGAIVCFFITMLLLELVKLEIPGDPIRTSLLRLVVSALDGIGGMILGTYIGRLLADPGASGNS